MGITHYTKRVELTSSIAAAWFVAAGLCMNPKHFDLTFCIFIFLAFHYFFLDCLAPRLGKKKINLSLSLTPFLIFAISQPLPA